MEGGDACEGVRGDGGCEEIESAEVVDVECIGCVEEGEGFGVDLVAGAEERGCYGGGGERGGCWDEAVARGGVAGAGEVWGVRGGADCVGEFAGVEEDVDCVGCEGVGVDFAAEFEREGGEEGGGGVFGGVVG